MICTKSNACVFGIQIRTPNVIARYISSHLDGVVCVLFTKYFEDNHKTFSFTTKVWFKADEMHLQQSL